jgi:Flp pilus assembly protein TadB
MRGPLMKNPTLLMGIATLVFLVVAFRLRHPILLVTAGIFLIITYQRFLHNYRLHRTQKAKLQQREDAIDVPSREIREEEHNP